MAQNNDEPNINENDDLKEVLSDSHKKEKEEKIDLEIKINRTSFIFFFLAIGVFGYIVVASIVPLQPFFFEELIPDKLELNAGLFTMLVVIALILLMIGLYFNWFWKGTKKVEQSNTQIEQIEEENSLLKSLINENNHLEEKLKEDS